MNLHRNVRSKVTIAQLLRPQGLSPVNDRKYVFDFRPKPNIWPEKHLALGRIPKPKPNVQIYIKIGGILQNSMFLMPYVTRYGSFFVQFW